MGSGGKCQKVLLCLPLLRSWLRLDLGRPWKIPLSPGGQAPVLRDPLSS